jgi:hypothetical protein
MKLCLNLRLGALTAIKKFYLTVLIVAVLSSFVYCRIDGFWSSSIQGPLSTGDAPECPLEVFEQLRQPYHYLAKGRQCFVFESDDKKTVIKFLNYRRFSLPPWITRLPLPVSWRKWLVEKNDARQSRFTKTIDSFFLAFRYLRFETGITYLHLQRGGSLPVVTLIDRGHRTHQIDLNKTAFIVQRRATPIFEELRSRHQLGGDPFVNEAIDAFVSFLQRRCALTLADDDRDVEINFGFVHGQLVLLDPGRLFIDPTLIQKERVAREMFIASRRLRKWLTLNAPSSAAFLDERLREAIESRKSTDPTGEKLDVKIKERHGRSHPDKGDERVPYAERKKYME